MRSTRSSRDIRRKLLMGNNQGGSSGLDAFKALGGTFWLPFNNKGGGIVDITPFGTPAGVVGTFTRATTAWTRLASGLWASVASGSPRSFYDQNLVYRGFLREQLRTNICLWARDLTNAAWIKTTMTAAKDEAGIDGAVNSCSTLTATAINALARQTITSAVNTRVFSAWVKRKTGSGSIFITQNGGGAETDITSLINTSTFTLVQIVQASITDPVVGFRIAVSGDAIIVDMCKSEVTQGAGGQASSPIPTTAAADSRNADLLTYPIGNINNAIGAMYGEALLLQIPGDNRTILGSTGDGALSWAFATSTTIRINDGTANLSSPTGNAGVSHKCAGAWGGATMEITIDGKVPASGAFDGAMPYATALNIGCTSNVNHAMNGALRNIKIFNRKLSPSQLQALTV